MTRPSLQPPDPTRARAFAAGTRPRGGSLEADLQRVTASDRQSTPCTTPPNRGARRWGTVAVDHDAIERVRMARAAHDERQARQARQARHDDRHGAGRRRLAAVPDGAPAAASRSASGSSDRAREAARADHPAGTGPDRRRSAVRRPVAALPATADERPAAAPRRPRRTAAAGFAPVATTATTATAATAATTTVSASIATARATRPVVTSAAAHLQVVTAIETAAVDGSAALAPRPAARPVGRPRTRTEEAEPRRRADLRVARAPRVPKTAGQRRRRRTVRILAAVLLVFAVFATGIAMHANLAKRQLVLDDLRVKVTDAERLNQRLRVEVAGLEAPAHVIAVAEEMGLVPADRVSFVRADTTMTASADPAATGAQ